MGEIAARGGNSAAGLEKLVAGEALESEFCRGEYIRIAFMDEGRKKVIALVAGMASLPPPACSTRKKLACARNRLSREHRSRRRAHRSPLAARPGMASLASIASGPRRDYLQPGLSCQRINGASNGTDARAWHGIIRGVKSLNGRVA